MSLLETFQRVLGLAEPDHAATSAGPTRHLVPKVDTEIMRFSPRRKDRMTLGDCQEGLLALGETGSGKTSSMRTLARALLQSGLGGLVCCVKDDEAQFWRMLAAEAGREADLVEFTPGGATFNFLDYESCHETEAVANLAAVLFEAAVIIGGKMETDIWLQAAERLARNLLTVLYCHRERIDLRDLYNAVLALPTDDEKPADWEASSVLAGWLRDPVRRPHPDLDISTAYVRQGWLRVPDRMRGSIAETFLILIDLLQRAPLPELLGGATTVSPDDCRRGKIVLLNYPVLTHGKAGRVAQVIFKVAAQRSFQRDGGRVGAAAAPRPVFLWVDECQYLVGPADALFSSTARTYGVVTVYLTQNLPNWYAEAGGTVQAQQRVMAVASNLTAKLFFLNSDPATNQFAANLIGKEKVKRESISTQSGRGPNQGTTRSITYTETDEFLCPPERFLALCNGRKRHGFICTAMLCKTGRKWSSGKRFLETRFDQRGRQDLSWQLTLAWVGIATLVGYVAPQTGVSPPAGEVIGRFGVPILSWALGAYERGLTFIRCSPQTVLDLTNQMENRVKVALSVTYAHEGWIYPTILAVLAVLVTRRFFVRRCARPTYGRSG